MDLISESFYRLGATGLWHGASWNFILWGLYFGVILAFEKSIGLTLLKKLPTFFQHIYLLFIVLMSWVLFVSEDLSFAIHYFKTMFGFTPLYDTYFLYQLYTNGLLFIIATIATTPLWRLVDRRLSIPIVCNCIEWIFILSILFLCTAYLVDESFNPFIFFHF